MRQNKVTIYETIDHYGFKTYWCCSRRHYWWKDAKSAAKCCNGWTPVYSPTYYSSGRPQDWGRWYEVGNSWWKIVVPDFLTDEITRLKQIYRDAHPQENIDVPVWDWENTTEEMQ